MAESMKEPIKVVELLGIGVHTGDTNGDAVDMRPSNYLAFEGALVRVAIGDITGTPDSLKISVEESDSSTFASGNTVAEGGEEVTVEADAVYTLQVKRTKRYIRVVLNFTGGSTPTAEAHAEAVINNWAKPYNLG